MGPLFFEETFTVEDYPRLLTHFTGLLEENGFSGLARRAHTANTTSAFLQKFFFFIKKCFLLITLRCLQTKYDI